MAQAGRHFVITWRGVAASGGATPVAGAGKAGPIVALTGQEAYQYLIRDLREKHGRPIFLQGYRIREAVPGEFKNP